MTIDPDRRRPTLPMPNELLGPGPTVVVASTYTGEDETAIALTLRPFRPYYAVVDLEAFPNWGWSPTHQTEHANIVEAVREYEQRGGDI